MGVWMRVKYCTHLVKDWLDSSCLRCWESSFFSRDRRIQARARPTSVLISPMFWMCLISWKREKRMTEKENNKNNTVIDWMWVEMATSNGTLWVYINLSLKKKKHITSFKLPSWIIKQPNHCNAHYCIRQLSSGDKHTSYPVWLRHVTQEDQHWTLAFVFPGH